MGAVGVFGELRWVRINDAERRATLGNDAERRTTLGNDAERRATLDTDAERRATLCTAESGLDDFIGQGGGFEFEGFC